jgi:hypothetical protein
MIMGGGGGKHNIHLGQQIFELALNILYTLLKYVLN